MADDEAVTVKVGVVLDSGSSIGKMGFSCMEMALSDFYELHRNYKTRLALFPKNSMEDVIEAAAAGLNLISLVTHCDFLVSFLKINLYFVLFSETKQLWS